jgi:hypothetical protein
MATKKKSKKKTSKKAKKSVNYSAVVTNPPQPETIFTTTATANTEDLPILTEEEMNACVLGDYEDATDIPAFIRFSNMPLWKNPNGILISITEYTEKTAESDLVREAVLVLEYDQLAHLHTIIGEWLVTHKGYSE